MTVFSIESLEYLRAHHGIASGRALEAVGLLPGDLRRLVDAGNLVPVLRGVYRMPAVPFDEPARCTAVCAAHPGAVISGPTAGRLWGLRRLPNDQRVHIVAPPASHPMIEPWVVPYRTRAFHAGDVVRRSDGILVTGRARTALDLARFVGTTDLMSIVEQVLLDGHLSDGDLRATAIDWMSPRRPWIRRFLEVLDARLRGGPAESHGEAVLGEALRSSGVRGIVSGSVEPSRATFGDEVRKSLSHVSWSINGCSQAIIVDANGPAVSRPASLSATSSWPVMSLDTNDRPSRC